jgi:hypothetical protein
LVRAGKDDPDFVVYSGEWQIGRIYERRDFPPDVRWSWSLYSNRWPCAYVRGC